MKKIFILLVLLGVMPLSLMAQDDDLYFTPKKTVETNSSSQIKVKEKASYYCGSNRDVDEYNRRGKFSSYCQKIGSDSLGNDIIEFHAGNELYPDSSYVDTAYIYPGSMQYQVDDNDGDAIKHGIADSFCFCFTLFGKETYRHGYHREDTRR